MIRFACPLCRTPLDAHLKCSCGFQGVYEDGKYHLHKTDASWDACLGQVAAVKEAIATAEASPPAPRSAGEVEAATQRVTSVLGNLQRVCLGYLSDVLQGADFLEIGGCHGWLSFDFMERGAKCGAILDIDVYNLSPSIAHPSRQSGDLIAIVGDGYAIPIESSSLDFVFDRATLHHFEDKPAVLREIYRVLKPGGLYVSAGNNPRSTPTDPGREEYMRLYGLIETNPTHEEYTRYFNEAFGNVVIQTVPDAAGGHVITTIKRGS
jgi:ubiquinone/menaquinone biosynthesis C-methylase UbiE